MAALACVLCFCELTKASDRNLVENKGEFSVKRELEDLHFVVHPTSQHICRACFRSLQQRRNHQNKVDDLNNKLLRQYREKAGQKGLAIKTKLTAKRSLSFNQSNDSSAPFSECGNSEHDSAIANCPTEIEHFRPRSTSTPCSTKQPRHEVESPSTQATIVSVTVQWKSRTSSRILPHDLQSIGKMLCRGTYTQVARAAWRCTKIREHIILLFLKEINRECANMCSKKNPSILRKINKEDIVNFSLTKFEDELRKRTPLLRSVLMAASICKSSLERSYLYWMPAVCMASSICLKNRSPHMTVVQLLNTIFIQHSGLMVCVAH